MTGIDILNPLTVTLLSFFNMHKTLQREAHVITHGQSLNFRIIKYFVLAGIMMLLYKIYGLEGVLNFLICGIITGLSLHLFFRWKTNGWRKSWGLYKKTSIPDQY